MNHYLDDLEKEPSHSSKKMKNYKTIKSVVQENKEGLKKGRLVYMSPETFVVQADRDIYHCSLKGTLKKELKQKKDRLACGDLLTIDPEKKVIVSLEPRHTILMRQNPSQKFQEQILATNIDFLLITASVLEPQLNPYLIDLYLIAAQRSGLDPIILINKVDLLQKKRLSEREKKEKELLEALEKQYHALNIPFIKVSALSLNGFKELKELMKDKASVFSGESGVGKSSLINSLGKSTLKVAPVSSKNKGIHTTTSSQLLQLGEGGWCVDTPGIQSFGLKNLTPEELSQCFPEFRQFTCKFTNCKHKDEQECSVKEGVEKKQISPLRLASYYRILEEIEHPKS